MGSVDEAHLPLLSGLNEQFYEYRCYKEFTSIVIFARAADRRLIILKLEDKASLELLLYTRGLSFDNEE